MVKSFSPGGVAERLKAHVLKTCLGHTNVGSNPTPSARLIRSDSFSNCPCVTEVALQKYWGGARVAEWARLLSECRGNSVAGSNPAFPAITKTRLQRRVFVCVVQSYLSLINAISASISESLNPSVGIWAVDLTADGSFNHRRR
jgi:hypothetical protein